MARISTYPILTPAASTDILLGTEIGTGATKNFTVSSIISTFQVANTTFISLQNAANTLSATLSATGVPSNTTYLRGDNTWAAIPVGTITDILAGTYITVTNSTGPAPTITHNLTSKTIPTNPTVTPAAGDTVDLVSSMTTNTTGHVTGVTTTEVTWPADVDTLYTLSKAANSSNLILKAGSSVQDTIAFAGTTDGIAIDNSAAQGYTLGLSPNTTITGIATAATFKGDLLGTVNTATTGVTQSPGATSNLIATTGYADASVGAQTFTYKGDLVAASTMNLATDTFFIDGGNNITTSTVAKAGNVGSVIVNLTNDVTVSGLVKAGSFKTSAELASWVGTILNGFTSITSTLFVGALTGNASTATALFTGGTMAINGDFTTSVAPVYTSGGSQIITASMASTVATAKVLTNLPTPTSVAIAADDTILAAMAKLQGQITSLPAGLAYEGVWNATTDSPALAGTTPASGTFYIVNVAGNTSLSGITDWLVGDWAIYVSAGGATDGWQKIDMTSDVSGTGAANKVSKWTGPNTLGTGLITDTGSLVTIGNAGDFLVEGSTTLGNATTDSVLFKGTATFEEAPVLEGGLGLGVGHAGGYGTAGQVLISGGGASVPNTWGSVGSVTSIALSETGDALTITGSPVTGVGTINIAGAGNSTQYINGALDLVAFPTVDNYVSWFIDADDASSELAVTSGQEVVFAGGGGIVTDHSFAAGSHTLAIDVDYVGASNVVLAAGTGVPVAGDEILFNNANVGTPGTVQRATISSIVDLGNETLAEVLLNGNTAGAKNIVFPDSTAATNGRVTFGASTDLEIYHDSNHGYVKTANGGDLKLEAADDVVIKSGTDGAANGNIYLSPKNGQNGIEIISAGAVKLFYNSGSGKFETTNTGVQITGKGTSDLTVAADAAATLVTKSYVDASAPSGTFTGSKVFASGTLLELFKIKKATTGALIFDVYLSASLSGSSNKKYTVAHYLGSTPTYNKIIDSGFTAAGGDLVVSFINSTTTATGDSVTCNITSTNAQTVSYTVQAGFDSVNAVSIS